MIKSQSSILSRVILNKNVYKVLGNGYERKFSDHKVLMNHSWTFLPCLSNNKVHLLAAGNHSYDFELVLPGSLPESTHVAKYYLVRYQLKALAERASFLLPNYATSRDLHLSRQKFSLSTDFLDPIMITSHWANKLDYEINLPTKVYSHGDTIPITIQAMALSPNLRIRYVSCTFKEYMTCRAINGWFNGKNKSHGKIIHYTRKDQENGQGILPFGTGVMWSTNIKIKIPESMSDIQCDAHNDSVRVKHKLKFTISIENQDGHISELRAVLPVVIAITNTIGGLPAYNETYTTLPYDPVLMMALIRRSTEGAAGGSLLDLIQNVQSARRLAELPTYSSIEESWDTRSLPNYDDLSVI